MLVALPHGGTACALVAEVQQGVLLPAPHRVTSQRCPECGALFATLTEATSHCSQSPAWKVVGSSFFGGSASLAEDYEAPQRSGTGTPSTRSSEGLGTVPIDLDSNVGGELVLPRPQPMPSAGFESRKLLRHFGLQGRAASQARRVAAPVARPSTGRPAAEWPWTPAATGNAEVSVSRDSGNLLGQVAAFEAGPCTELMASFAWLEEGLSTGCEDDIELARLSCEVGDHLLWVATEYAYLRGEAELADCGTDAPWARALPQPFSHFQVDSGSTGSASSASSAVPSPGGVPAAQLAQEIGRAVGCRVDVQLGEPATGVQANSGADVSDRPCSAIPGCCAVDRPLLVKSAERMRGLAESILEGVRGLKLQLTKVCLNGDAALGQDCS